MIVSKQNKWVHMYQAMYPASYLPKGICPLFWKVIIGIILTLTSPLFLVYWVGRKVCGKPFYGFNKYKSYQLINSFGIDKLILVYWFCSIGIVYYDPKYGILNIEWYNYILAPMISAGFIILVLSIIIGIGYSIETISNKIKYHNSAAEEKEPNIFIEGIKSFFNKICPTITYKD